MNTANQPQDLKTDPELLRAIANAPQMTAAQIAEQRTSWVFGQLGARSKLTKEQVREILDRNLNGLS